MKTWTGDQFLYHTVAVFHLYLALDKIINSCYPGGIHWEIVCRLLVCFSGSNTGHLWCNIIYLCSLFYGLLSGLGSLLRMFCFLCFTFVVSNKLYYTGDDPTKHLKIGYLHAGPFNIFAQFTGNFERLVKISYGKPKRTNFPPVVRQRVNQT